LDCREHCVSKGWSIAGVLARLLAACAALQRGRQEERAGSHAVRETGAKELWKRRVLGQGFGCGFHCGVRDGLLRPSHLVKTAAGVARREMHEWRASSSL